MPSQQSHRLGAKFILKSKKQSTKLTGEKKRNKPNIQSFQFCPFPSATGENQPQIFNRQVMDCSPKNTCSSATAQRALRPLARAALGAASAQPCGRAAAPSPAARLTGRTEVSPSGCKAAGSRSHLGHRAGQALCDLKHNSHAQRSFPVRLSKVPFLLSCLAVWWVFLI